MKINFLPRKLFLRALLTMPCALMLSATSLMAQLQPQVTGNHAKEKLVTNKNWTRVWNLTSEWDSFNSDHWTKTPVEGPWTWAGRWPGLFEEDNVSIWNGELRIEAEKFTSPKLAANWTHGGGVVRSRAKMQKGMYVECSMKTTETIMSGTFWLINPPGSCPRVEVDITESVGVTSNRATWLGGQFSTGMNSNVHGRGGCVDDDRDPHRSNNFDPDATYHTYGLYWESETKLHFYHNGRFMWTITPPSDAVDDMHIMMVVETYNHNLPSTGPNADVIDGFTKPKWRRLTRYQWVRTWRPVAGNSGNRELGVDELGSDQSSTASLTAFPNPASDVLTIEGISEVTDVVVTDMTGRQVLATSTSGTIDVRSLESGVYLLKVLGTGQSVRFKKD
ncbi:T9SS type A sorting domain-containing protein [Reichenbachiella versicolor]|uniref:T9SS type A sorting domain-containing protein n=1 Tax=Reichenbachiella versicolor TaxID=1821036 RepID=UPI000D6E248E|nr:T9SS type A sorting domain-containing protein [Reichenbachiella versicolor]